MTWGTKLYAAILGIICLILSATFLYEAPKVKTLNKQLYAIKEINDFPYRFKVLRVDNDIATVNSPISTELPCGKVIAIIFPALKGKSLLSEEYQIAQQQLASVQMRVTNIVKSDPDIKKIIWELDRTWLIQNGISFNNL